MAGIRGGTRGEYVGRAVECYWDSYGEWFAGAKEGACLALLSHLIWGRGGSMLVAPDGPLRQNLGPTLPQNDNDAVHVLCFCRLRGRGPQRSMLGVRGGRSLLVHQRGHLGHERF